MESSSSTLAYKGSITDAIAEAQTNKKLFVVYISGDDDVSTSLEQSTWMDQRVAETISKYCIFLHLVEGTVDASQFSAIYPQKSIPSISAVGCNGVMIWQHEGLISAENLVKSVEKAWATLQLQETAAAILSAALASKNSEPSSSSIVASSEKGNSSDPNVTSTSANNSQNSGTVPLTNSRGSENGVEESASEKEKELDKTNFQRLIHGGSDEDEQSDENHLPDGSHIIATSISSETDPISYDHGQPFGNPGIANEVEENAESVNVGKTNCSVALESTRESSGNDPVHICDSKSQENSRTITKIVDGRRQEENVEGLARSSNVIKSTDVHLNIRLPNGTCLPVTFSLTDSLQSVKKYVDENAVTSLGAYDLAIPYPRKIFMEQDMTKTFSELGFASREALIVVPHQHGTVARQVQSSSYDTNAVNESNPSNGDGGYFVFLKKMLSYINPFSYLGGGTSHFSSMEPGPSDLRHEGSTSFENYPSIGRGSYRPYASGERPPQPGDNANMARRRTSSRFGSNIHTLTDVEGEDPPSDRNVFWNGNSTQFGGDDKN